ncbi:MAG TPA: hypothetical protein VK213_03395 [Bacteroidales bacterium]|nr:hypothetical protein [Bacteroidales bacterium]
MDFNSTIDLMIRELEEACDILEDIRKSPHPQVLKIELARSKCRNVAGVIALLKEISNVDEKNDVRNINTPDEKEPEKTFHKEPAPERTENQIPLPEISGPEINIHESVIVEKPVFQDEKIEPDKEPGKPFVAPIIADTFSHLARFNEQLGNTQEYQGKTITNLTEAIGVNDRFYYIRELFNGKRDEYDNIISKLEKAESMEEVNTILVKYRNAGNDNEAYRNLVDLVKRKFSK